MHRGGLTLLFVIIAITSLHLARSASAQDSVWIGGTGFWGSSSNWQSNLVPNFNRDAYINNGGTAQMGIFFGTAEANSLTLGSSIGQLGTVQVSGPGTLATDFDITLGRWGTGTLNITSGGVVSSNTAVIGEQLDSVGIVTVTGKGSKWIAGTRSQASYFPLEVGARGSGTLTIEEGGAANFFFGRIGGNTEGVGRVTVTGRGSTLTGSGGLTVGWSGIGTLTIADGGTVSTNSGEIAANTAGTVAVTGADSRWNMVTYLIVGNGGNATMQILDGGIVSNASGYIGRHARSTGAMTVDGAFSTWANSGDLYVGETGTGALRVSRGATVLNSNGNIGANAGSIGTASVDGAESVWHNSSVLAVGSSGKGALSITSGGKVYSTNGRIARNAGSTGTVLIDGPGSRWNASGVFTMGLSGTGASTLTVQNGGVLAATGGLTIGPLGALQGDGTIISNVFNAGTVAPGESPGTLRVNGNFAQSVSGRLQIELAAASFDKLDVTGEITLDNTLFGPPMGGTLEVSLTGGYVPSGSLSFDILDWGGSLSGAFSTIVLPTLGGTLVWDTSQLYTTGVLSVTGPPAVAGDFDKNGTVDAADYVVWRNIGGLPSDYDSWRANFSRTVGSGSVATVGSPSSADAAVPEPTSAWLCGTCLGALLLVPAVRTRKQMISSDGCRQLNHAATEE